MNKVDMEKYWLSREIGRIKKSWCSRGAKKTVGYKFTVTPILTYETKYASKEITIYDNSATKARSKLFYSEEYTNFRSAMERIKDEKNADGLEFNVNTGQICGIIKCH